MSRRLVWILTVTGVAAVAAATASAQQFRGYGDSYGAAPDYYDGGVPVPYGGYGTSGRRTGPYGGGRDDGPGPYGYDGGRGYGGPGYDPDDGPPPRRFRGPMQGYGGQGYGAPDQGYNAPPRVRRPSRDFDERDYGYGYDQGPAPDANDPYGAPGRRASDADLGENANRTTMTEVENTTHQPPGTIVINTAERHLYYTQPGGQALQYGIGVGRQGFTWKGTAAVKRKAEWPDWIPPSDMLKRRPDLPTRMAGGIENPLGARALYLFQGQKDTMFRIHGTNEPDTIGKAVSSGCIRMMNADVIDLYRRVPVGTKVVVL